MANIAVRNASGDLVYMNATGTGTVEDPFIPANNVTVSAGTNKIGTVVTAGGSNYSDTLPLTFKRTLVADTDQSIDIPIGVKLAYVYHALATPVHAALDATVTLPVAGAAGQHTMMYPPNSGVAYAIFDVPTTVDTHDFHVRSASAGDIWVTLTKEGSY